MAERTFSTDPEQCLAQLKELCRRPRDLFMLGRAVLETREVAGEALEAWALDQQWSRPYLLQLLALGRLQRRHPWLHESANIHGWSEAEILECLQFEPVVLSMISGVVSFAELKAMDLGLVERLDAGHPAASAAEAARKAAQPQPPTCLAELHPGILARLLAISGAYPALAPRLNRLSPQEAPIVALLPDSALKTLFGAA